MFLPKFHIILVALLGLIIFSSPAAPALAATKPIVNIWEGITCNVVGACSLCDAAQLIVNIINFLTQLALVGAAAMIVWGGIKMMLPQAGGFSAGKSIIWNAMLGVAVVLSAWLIVNTLMHVLASGRLEAPWNEIKC